VTTVETGSAPPLTIAEAAVETGLTAHTLRYYERDSLLLSPPGRTASGHRAYSAEDLRWIRMLTLLRSTGMSIADLRRYADLVRSGVDTTSERLDLLTEHRAKVEQQMAEVAAHLRAIDHKIGLYQALLDSPEQRA
jgi:DNA-binding transcriptional MerR regulator